jgi:hypothetical protein
LRPLTDGINQLDLAYSGVRVLAASGTEDLDLAGSLTDIYGNTLTFARVRLIAFQVIGGSAGTDLTIGPASSNGFGTGTMFADASDRVRVVGGGLSTLVLTHHAGAAVTAGTGDKLTVTNASGSASITYKVVILGTSV